MKQAEIDTLVADGIRRDQEIIAELRAKNEQLTRALQPFSQLSLPEDSELEELGEKNDFFIKYADIRAARAALTESTAVQPDLSAFSRARFGVFRPDGRFEELPQDSNLAMKDPQAFEGRWVGGIHDMQLIRAVLLTLGLAPPTS